MDIMSVYVVIQRRFTFSIENFAHRMIVCDEIIRQNMVTHEKSGVDNSMLSLRTNFETKDGKYTDSFSI